MKFIFLTLIALSCFAVPQNPSGFQEKHRFPGQTDYINILSWGPSSSLVTGFRIYRDHPTNLIAETQHTSYQDHQRSPNVITTYFITEVSSGGAESAPVIVMVP